jgi:hypothetical protein
MIHDVVSGVMRRKLPEEEEEEEEVRGGGRKSWMSFFDKGG